MWDFRKLGRGEPERDSREAEYFRRLTDPAEAIVREFVQNSLDAKRNNPVRVYFTLGDVDRETVYEFLYLKELEKHLECCDLLPPDYYKSKKFPFLVIEDFSTTGLDGDTGEENRPVGRNNFYNFWLCEGKSWKSGSEAGRWGLGKLTFYTASKIRTIWGLTVRADDLRELLMGKAFLKTHRINGEVYDYYGYFRKDYKPISEESFLRKFKHIFSLRRNNEPGLSLVIPFPSSEIEVPSLIRSVIIQWFFAIMKGLLEVEIGGQGGNISLNATNLVDFACSQNWQGTSFEGLDVKGLLQFVDQVSHKNPDIRLKIQDPENPEITEGSFNSDLAQLRESFLAGNTVSFRVPLIIRKNNGSASSTYFDLHFVRCPQLRESEEFYFRSGISISDIKMMRSRPIRALLVAEEDAITSFLGDSETPAHTEWNERTEGFKEKYANASRILRFLKKAPIRIIEILDQPPQELQKDFLKEIFYIPKVLEVKRLGDEITGGPHIPPIEPSPAPFSIYEVSRGHMHGFKMYLGRTDFRFPIRARIKVAYDVRRGNPFDQYEIQDFDFEGSQLSIDYKGCRIISKKKNILEIEVVGRNFSLSVTGFDRNRDLVVSAVIIR